MRLRCTFFITKKLLTIVIGLLLNTREHNHKIKNSRFSLRTLEKHHDIVLGRLTH